MKRKKWAVSASMILVILILFIGIAMATSRANPNSKKVSMVAVNSSQIHTSKPASSEKQSSSSSRVQSVKSSTPAQAKSTTKTSEKMVKSESGTSDLIFRVYKRDSVNGAIKKYHTLKNPPKATGQPVKLTNGIKAVKQGTMGHVYVQWQHGKWLLTVIMNSADAMTPKKVISKVAVIQQHLNQLKLLSQKVNQGSVKIYADPQRNPVNQISWRTDTKVGEVVGNDWIPTVKAAVQELGQMG